MIPVGLRVDIDTLNGARTGLPCLLNALGRFGIKASFFFSVGPDNMGRHIWRLFRRGFLLKMVRSRAASLYGWDILLRGVFLPGPVIGKVLSPHVQRAEEEGHEVGLHAWDHHRWQRRADRMSAEKLTEELRRGLAVIAELTKKTPQCFAAPSWRCTDTLLRVERSLALRYGSDCRGSTLFLPLLDDRCTGVPQIPVTLPTYDEVIGLNGITNQNYNDYLLSLVKGDQLNVLTIHAEVEGMRHRVLFEDFIQKALEGGITFVPLGSLLPDDLSALPSGTIRKGAVPGREGWVAVQARD